MFALFCVSFGDLCYLMPWICTVLRVFHSFAVFWVILGLC